MVDEKLIAESLQEKSYKILKKAILKNEFKPGERLIDVKIAQQFGISRTPIRDAIKMLEKEGLVKNEGTKGCYVIPITRDKINEIYEFRLMAETYVLRNVHCSVILKKLVKLNSLIDKTIDSCDDISDAIDLDHKFHEALITAANNKLLLRIYREVNLKMMVYWNFIYASYNSPNEFKEVNMQHKEIVSAISENNIKLAEELLITHVNKSRHGALELI